MNEVTFQSLKLPKELSKKKKMDLYKCWLLDPLVKGSAERHLEMDTDDDIYALTSNAAVFYAIKQLFITMKDIHAIEKVLMTKHVVIGKFTLVSAAMTQPIIIPPPGVITTTDPMYDETNLTLRATVKDRVSEIELKDYGITSLKMNYNSDIAQLEITELELAEKIINKSLTGG